MEILQQKKLLIERILPYSTGAPADAAQRLLQQSVSDLEHILDDAITKKVQAQATEQANQHAADMRSASVSEGAWTHACCALINGKRLALVQANRDLLESLLNPGEEPSAKLYIALAQQYPQRFAWSAPPKTQSDEERRAEFAKICRENLLSECLANQQLHKDGVSLDAWAGTSGIERAKFQQEAAQARQQFLIHHATPSQLKAEAAYQSQTEHDAAVQAEADRSHQFVLSQQQHYPALPSTNVNGEGIDAAYLRKISTTNFPLFKQLVKKHGSGNVTARLRGEN
jgi:hypothetical protein